MICFVLKIWRNISIEALKRGWKAIDYLCIIVRWKYGLIIQQNVIPAEWKKAKVNPLPKSGTKDDPRNYRPIFVLPVVSKVLERLIHKQLASHFDEHNLLCKSQSAFRIMHSTETTVRVRVRVRHFFFVIVINCFIYMTASFYSIAKACIWQSK